MKIASVNFFGTVAFLTVTLLLFRWSDGRSPEYLAQPLDTIGKEINGWVQDGTQPLDQQVLHSLLPTSYVARSYQKDNQHLGLFVAYYAQQRAGETMHSPKNCLPGSGWEIWKNELVDVQVSGRNRQINKYYIENAGQKLVVFYWYQSRTRIIADEYMGKLYLIRDAIQDASAAGALVRVTVADDAEAARQGQQFSAAVIPQLDSCFGRLKPRRSS